MAFTEDAEASDSLAHALFNVIQVGTPSTPAEKRRASMHDRSGQIVDAHDDFLDHNKLEAKLNETLDKNFTALRELHEAIDKDDGAVKDMETQVADLQNQIARRREDIQTKEGLVEKQTSRTKRSHEALKESMVLSATKKRHLKDLVIAQTEAIEETYNTDNVDNVPPTFATLHVGFETGDRETAKNRAEALLRLADVETTAQDGSEPFTKAYCLQKLSHLNQMNISLIELGYKRKTGTYIVLLHGKALTEAPDMSEPEPELILWQPEQSVFTAMTPAATPPRVWVATPGVFLDFADTEMERSVAEADFLSLLKENLAIPNSEALTAALCFEFPSSSTE